MRKYTTKFLKIAQVKPIEHVVQVTFNSTLTYNVVTFR